MKFVMIDKGYEYATEDGKITIKKYWVRKRQHKCEHSTLDTYKTVAEWTIYGLKENYVYKFNTLAEAKKFVIDNID